MANLVTLAPTRKERFLAGISHLFVLIPFLGFIAPRIIYTTQKDKSEYIAFQSHQAFIYQLITLLVWLVGMALVYVLPIFWIWFFLVMSGINLIARSTFVAYGIFGAVMAFQGKSFRYLIVSDKLESFWSIFMDKQWRARFMDIQKCPTFPFAVGFVVACVHNLVTHLLKDSYFPNFGAIVMMMLSSPGYALLLSDFPSLSTAKFINSFTELPFIVSSVCFGIVGGFLASRNIYLQSLGFILVFLLILSGCALVMLAGLVFA